MTESKPKQFPKPRLAAVPQPKFPANLQPPPQPSNHYFQGQKITECCDANGMCDRGPNCVGGAKSAIWPTMPTPEQFRLDRDLSRAVHRADDEADSRALNVLAFIFMCAILGVVIVLCVPLVTGRPLSHFAIEFLDFVQTWLLATVTALNKS